MTAVQRFGFAVLPVIALFAGTPALADTRCALERPNSEPSSLRFEIDGSTVRAFEAQTVISSDSPDLRPGYAAWTCHRSLTHFEQAKKGDLLVLKHRGTKRSDEESSACQVLFHLKDNTVRAFTSGCRTSCMTFDFTFERAGKLCHDG